MAKDAFYFSHDSNARNDEKIISVRMKHDWKGYGLYWAIVEKLRDNSYYRLPLDYNMISYDLRADSAIIKSIINDFGLFVIEDNYFYSESLLRRMEMKEEKSLKAKESVSKRWENERLKKLDGKGSYTNVLPPNNECNTSKEKKRKEKQIKVKEIKVNIPSLEVFLNYSLENVGEDFDSLKKSLELKYKSWLENGWKTGKGVEIKNWKSTLLNTIPYLEKEKNFAKKENYNGKQTNYHERKASIIELNKLSGQVLQSFELNEDFASTGE